MTYGLYAAMSEFFLDVETMCDDPRSFALKAKGMTALAIHGFMTNIDPKTIEDKTKADHLHKIACFFIGILVSDSRRSTKRRRPSTIVLEMSSMFHIALVVLLLSDHLVFDFERCNSFAHCKDEAHTCIH